MRYSNKIKIAVFALSLIASFGVVGMVRQGEVHAAANNNYQNIPVSVRNYLTGCNGSANEAAQSSWLSPVGDPLGTDFEVPYGATSVDVQWNSVVYICSAGLDANGNVATSRVGTNFKILSSNPASLPGFTGASLFVPYGENNNRYTVRTLTFTYQLGGPVTNNFTRSFSGTGKGINWKRNNTFECVTNPGDVNFRVPNRIDDFGACRSQYTLYFTINGVIKDDGPAVTVTANCSSITVQATDPQIKPPQYQYGETTGLGIYIDDEPIALRNDYRYNERYTREFPASYKDAFSRTVKVVVRNKGSQGSRLDVTKTRVVPACKPPTCIAPQRVMNSPPQSPDSFGVKVGFDYGVSDTRGRALRWAARVQITNATPTSATTDGWPNAWPYWSSSGVPYNGGSDAPKQNDVTLNPPFEPSAGDTFDITYQIRYKLHWNADEEFRLDCNGTVTIPNQTYLRVYGNDIQAGGGFAPSCTVQDNGAAVEGFSASDELGGATTWRGSSGQFAVSALGAVDGFFSSSMRGAESTTDFARPPVGQTFGNTTNMTSKVGVDSGGDSGVKNCIPDYLGDAPVETGSNVISTRTVNGKQALLFEGRDVFITGTGIRYQGANTGWNTIEDIPSFYLVVKGGNIYIDPSVTELDGVYIAQPAADGTKGEIITCATAAGVVPAHGGCGQQLVINGAFIARQVQFKRVFGKLTEATAGESVADTKAAEVFNFSPEVYLSPLNDNLTRAIPFTKYDYITSLPPIL